ncbi:hypothetical protein [Brumimicrobium mesophilum]|uniref:hypothetical protein n=1 Tax=Brumimicrobium mesophilum TaxID=392717 RepID=UPI000D143F23|nr:hypothetical protein [Brumimicrobium mesophilum]
MKINTKFCKLTLSIFIIILINGCSSYSEDEQELIKTLENKYECKIEVKKEEDLIIIIFSKCVIDEKKRGEISSNSSLSALNTLSKINDFTKVKIIFPENAYFEYKINDLVEVNKSLDLYYLTFEELKSKKYEPVYNKLWSEIRKTTTLEDFISYIQTVDKKANFAQLEFKEFKFGDMKEDNLEISFIRFIGQFKNKKDESFIFELFIPTKGNDEIYGLLIETL